VALINLASEAWTLLSDDLFSVIFRQSTEPSADVQPSQQRKDTFQMFHEIREQMNEQQL